MACHWWLFAVCVALVAATEDVGPSFHNPDIDLTTAGLVARYGYPIEVHHVTTADGYILELHRIPRGKGQAAGKRPPVLLQHGLLCSSADWVVMGPGKGLGYILADAGYDVWMGNARGNTYSRNHTDSKMSENEFWNFSWHEMGMFDLPAVIDYVLAENGAPKLFYAGHSMGTTMFFVLASQRPEYNDKVHAMFALAPVAHVSNMFSPFLRIASDMKRPLEWALKMFGVNEFFPRTEFLAWLGQLICKDHMATQTLCSSVLFLIAGPDPSELNTTSIPVILGHTPAGASVKTLLHYAQEIHSGKFRQYDYGWWGNIRHYGSRHPPEYNLSKVTAPVALFFGDNDWLSAPKDVDTLFHELPKPVGKILVPHHDFNHLDFLWATDAKALIYDEVASLMHRYMKMNSSPVTTEYDRL